jgi:hypothetical protein
MKGKPRKLDERRKPHKLNERRKPHKARRANKLEALEITEDFFVELPPALIAFSDAAYSQAVIDAELAALKQWYAETCIGGRVSLIALLVGLHLTAYRLPPFLADAFERLLEWHLGRIPMTRDQTRFWLMRNVCKSENLPLWSDACLERTSEIAGKHHCAGSMSTMKKARKIGSKKQREQRKRLLQLYPPVFPPG